MAERKLKIWYDPEGDYLEVIFEQRAGIFRETSNDQVMEKVDEEGNILGFSVLNISALKEAPLELVLKDTGCEGNPAWVREGSPRMEVFPGISIDPAVHFGKPCLSGTRVDIATVIGALAAGEDIGEVENAYNITREQILISLRYAAHLAAHAAPSTE